MSIALMTDVWKVNIQSAKKMVLLALADSANDEGTNCFPSVATIIEKCSMGERTVFRHLAALEDDGLISRHERPGRSTNYVLNVVEIQVIAAKNRRNRISTIVDNSNDEEAVIHRATGSTTPANLAGVPANPHDIHTPANLTGVPNWHTSPANLAPTPANLAPITTTEPLLNHNNHNAEIYPHGLELPRGCGGDSEIETSQAAIADLIWPICSTEERTALTGILVTLPQAQHQILLDELEGARQAGTIRKNLVLFAGALVRAMHKGTFTVGYSPAVAAKRREQSQRSTSVECLRTFRPEIAADAAAEGQRLMEKIRQQSLSRKAGTPNHGTDNIPSEKPNGECRNDNR